MVISGVDPNAKDTTTVRYISVKLYPMHILLSHLAHTTLTSFQIECPDPNCGATVYIGIEKLNVINKGTDVGQCRACKQKFGKIFCMHCFASWTTILHPEQEGKIISCIMCKRQFALVYPKPQRRSAPQVQAPQKPAPAKKRKVTNWWEKPS